jgi:hypothetical protein
MATVSTITNVSTGDFPQNSTIKITTDTNVASKINTDTDSETFKPANLHRT